MDDGPLEPLRVRRAEHLIYVFATVNNDKTPGSREQRDPPGPNIRREKVSIRCFLTSRRATPKLLLSNLLQRER